MPKKIGSVTRQALVNATLPAATQTYTVISHQFVIDTVMEQLQNNGFNVEKELYKCTEGAQVASGWFKLTYGDDPDLSLMYAFGNSYDKTMKFKSAIGAYVNQNDAVMISRFNDWTRKHTGSADDETVETITTQIEDAANYFDELKKQKDMMSQITVSRIEFASLVGQLYFLKFITADQISIVLKEYDNPTYTYTLPNDNLWTCYNHILVALKRTHPKNWIDNQIAVHLHICNNYRLFDYDDVEEEDLSTVDEDVVEESLENVDPRLTTIEEESTMSEEIILPGFDNNNDYTPENEEEINKRMDVIGQNGNEGLHYDEAAETEKFVSEAAEVMMAGTPSTMKEEMTTDEVVDDVDEVIENPVITEEPDTNVAYDLDAEEDADWEKLPISEVKQSDNTEEESTVEATEDEVVSQLYGVDNDIEVSIPVAEEEEEIVEEDLSQIPEPVEEVEEAPVAAETFYFMKEDYEGVEVGDYIEEDGVYYEIINDESGDDGDFWVCVEVNVAIDETEEQVTEPASEIVVEETVEEELPAELEAIVEEMETNANMPYQDPALKEVIKSELSILYDYDDAEFTYELVDGQYNITLASGETCSFAQSYIEQQV